MIATILIAILLSAQAHTGAGTTTTTPSILSASDRQSPEIARVDSCGAGDIRLVVRDTAFNDRGIASVRVEGPDASSVLFEPRIPLIPGDRIFPFRVALLPGVDDASILLIAEDLAGNLDTLELRLLRRFPSLSNDSLDLLTVGRRETRNRTITILNPSSDAAMRVDRLDLRVGTYFGIDKINDGSFLGLPLNPGETFDALITFTRGLDREYFDTLVVTIDCIDYLIPLHATLGVSRLALGNIDFWQVILGTEKCVMMPIWNPGTDTTYISAIEVRGGEFRFDTTAIPFLPDRVPPGDTIEIPVCFFPRRLGLLLGSVTFVSSAADTTSVASQLAGIGVTTFTSVGFDSDGKLLQISVVPQEQELTVISADRSRDLTDFRLFNLRGEEIPITLIELVGRGWWQIQTRGRLIASMYYLQAIEAGKEPLVVKFVVLE